VCKNKIQYYMKTMGITLLRLLLVLSILAGLVFLLWHWPFHTILAMIAIVKIYENWEIVVMVVVVSVLSVIGGFAMIWLVHLVCTGQLLIDLHTLWGIGWLFACIYALALIIEEDHRRPYIWLWQKLTTLRKLVIV